jgi:hypothetical protein
MLARSARGAKQAMVTRRTVQGESSMKTEYLAFRNAEKLVQAYAQEWRDWEARCERAVVDPNAEALLQMGIDAFEWLLRADRAARAAIYEHRAQFDPKFEQALETLCADWLATAKRAEARIPQASGEIVENLPRFRQCLEEMEAIVEAFRGSSGKLPSDLAKLRDAAGDEQRHGKAAKFI